MPTGHKAIVLIASASATLVGLAWLIFQLIQDDITLPLLLTACFLAGIGIYWLFHESVDHLTRE